MQDNYLYKQGTDLLRESDFHMGKIIYLTSQMQDATNYDNMRLIYIDMLLIYVNMRVNYVNMQDIYVNMQNDYVYMQFFYNHKRNNLHVDINTLHVGGRNISPQLYISCIQILNKASFFDFNGDVNTGW